MYRLFLFLCLLFCSCATVAARRPNVVVHLDTQDLSTAQRHIVQEAEDSWYRQTRGCVVFDEGGDILVSRMVPPDKYDDPDAGKYVIGVTSYHRVEISFSRIPTIDLAVITVAHELGHVLGMHHGDEKNSLMNPVVNPNTHISLTAKERDQLYELTGCR